MVLARAVYDGTGTQLLNAGMALDARHLPVLGRLEVREILVQDPRVDDVIIEPLISEGIEARATRLLHRLLDGNRGRSLKYIQLDVVSLDRVVKAMLQELYSAFMGEIDVAGCHSLGNYEYVHPVKTASLCLMLGKEAGIPRSELAHLGIAALLQNISYILLPRNMVTNLDPTKGDLPEDYKKHPEWGYYILRRYPDIDAKAQLAVLQHHERWNGEGFPKGLKGDQISLFARIIAIASTYHALVSKRPNQQPYPPPEAAEYISAYSGELFDPQLAQLFIRSVPFYPKGISVKLNTGEGGIVTNANVGYIGRPVVRICSDRYGDEVSRPYDIDLTDTEYQSKLITEILEY